jgi:hypothetical protein
MWNRFFFLIGSALLIYLSIGIGWQLYHAPGRMCLGPHGIPIPMEGDVPGYHPDGAKMNQLDGILLQRGYAEAVYGGSYFFVTVALLYAIWEIRRCRKLKREADLLAESFERYMSESGNSTPEAIAIMHRLQSAQRKLSWSGRLPTDLN